MAPELCHSGVPKPILQRVVDDADGLVEVPDEDDADRHAEMTTGT